MICDADEIRWHWIIYVDERPGHGLREMEDEGNPQSQIDFDICDRK